MKIGKKIAGLLVGVMAAGAGLVMATPAQAGTGYCDIDDLCLYYNSNQVGAFFGTNGGYVYLDVPYPENYGDPNWYKFGGGGNGTGWGGGNGINVKNHAASVYNNNINYTAYIYYYSNINPAGPVQQIRRRLGTYVNLNSDLKNENASQCFDYYSYCP